MCLKVIVLRISGYINHTLGFLLGPSKCLYGFYFSHYYRQIILIMSFGHAPFHTAGSVVAGV